jgi:hypothetical protein
MSPENRQARRTNHFSYFEDPKDLGHVNNQNNNF